MRGEAAEKRPTWPPLGWAAEGWRGSAWRGLPRAPAPAPARDRRKEVAMEAPAPVVAEGPEAPLAICGEQATDASEGPSKKGQQESRLQSDQIGGGSDEEHDGGS